MDMGGRGGTQGTQGTQGVTSDWSLVGSRVGGNDVVHVSSVKGVNHANIVFVFKNKGTMLACECMPHCMIGPPLTRMQSMALGMGAPGGTVYWKHVIKYSANN